MSDTNKLRNDGTDNTVLVAMEGGTVRLSFDGYDPISKGENEDYDLIDGLTNVRNVNHKIPRGKQMRDLRACVGGTLSFNDNEYKIVLDCRQPNGKPKREEAPAGYQRAATHPGMMTFDDFVLQRIIEFLPDPETACHFGASCSVLRSLVQNEQNFIWDRFLQKISLAARPKKHGEDLERTNREIVLRFASARIFASRMERLAPSHRVMLGEGNYFPGCAVFPDLARGYIEERRGDAYFVRYLVKGSLIWQGFLPSRMMSNGDMHLGYDDFRREFDLSQEFDWPEMKACLEHAPPQKFGILDINDREWINEKTRMKIELYKHLTLTIVMIDRDDIADRKLCICTSGPDKDGLGPFGYCCFPHMEIMPVLSHGISPVEPLVEGYDPNPYFRTSHGSRHCSGDYVAVGHNYVFDRELKRQKYVGPVFGRFHTYSLVH